MQRPLLDSFPQDLAPCRAQGQRIKASARMRHGNRAPSMMGPWVYSARVRQMDGQSASWGCKCMVLVQIHLGPCCKRTSCSNAIGAAEHATVEAMIEIWSKRHQTDDCAIEHPLLSNCVRHFAFRIGAAPAKDAGISPWQKH